MLRSTLKTLVFYALAPILVHCAVGGTAFLCATLLLDFVDTFSTLIVTLSSVLLTGTALNKLFNILSSHHAKSFTTQLTSLSALRGFSKVRESWVR